MPLPDTAIVRAPRVTVLSRPTFAEPVQHRAEWKGESTDGERLAEYAERLRTSSHHNPAGRETRDYLRTIAAQGHDSALEHAHYSLLIEGVSIAVTHELQRDSAGFACTELAQRHVDASDTCFVMPPAMIGSADLEATWLSQVQRAFHSYTELVNELMTRYAWVGDQVHRRKLAREAAGSVLPRCTASNLVLTGSARAWRTLLDRRCSEPTELELRRLAVQALRVLVAEAPAFFDDFEIYLAPDRREAARIPDR